MSDARTIKAYIHHNAPQVFAGSGNLQKPPLNFQNTGFLASKPRVPLSQGFPLDQCSDVLLKESVRSVGDGLKYALSDYQLGYYLTSFCFRHDPYYTGGDHRDQRPVTLHPEHEDAPDLSDCSTESLRSTLTLPSILLRNGGLPQDGLFQLFREVLARSVLNEFELSYLRLDEPLFKEAFNYALNLLMQQFKASSTKELCLEVMRCKKNGTLEDVFDGFAYDFSDKYEDIALEHYEDLVLEAMVEMHFPDLATTTNPSFYLLFKAAWVLQPHSILQMRIHAILDESRDSMSKPYGPIYDANFDAIEKFGIVAFRMNMLRSYYNYRAQLRHTPSLREYSPRLGRLSELALLLEKIQQLMDSSEDTGKKKSKAKLLRFSDDLVTGDV